MFKSSTTPTVRPRWAPNPRLTAFIEAMGELIARRVLAEHQASLKRCTPHPTAGPKGGQ
jgi:hypothetical protein